MAGWNERDPEDDFIAGNVLHAPVILVRQHEDETRRERHAVVRSVNRVGLVEAYLPDNYKVHSVHAAEPVVGGRIHVVITGKDVAGWTLDGYIIPRLASGLIYAKEYPTLHDAIDSACAAMN